MSKTYLAYHGTLIGLNYWPDIIKLALIVAIVVGFFQYTKGKNGARRRYNERLLNIATAIFSIAFLVAFSLETWRGVVVWLQRSMTTSGSEDIAFILAPFVIIGAAAMFAGVMLWTGDLVARATKAAINRKYNNNNNK